MASVTMPDRNFDLPQLSGAGAALSRPGMCSQDRRDRQLLLVALSHNADHCFENIFFKNFIPVFGGMPIKRIP
jgi:hypothetical protein